MGIFDFCITNDSLNKEFVTEQEIMKDFKDTQGSACMTNAELAYNQVVFENILYESTMIDVLNEGIKEAWGGFKEWVKGLLEKLKKFILTIIEKIKKFFGKFKKKKDGDGEDSGSENSSSGSSKSGSGSSSTGNGNGSNGANTNSKRIEDKGNSGKSSSSSNGSGSSTQSTTSRSKGKDLTDLLKKLRNIFNGKDKLCQSLRLVDGIQKVVESSKAAMVKEMFDNVVSKLGGSTDEIEANFMKSTTSSDCTSKEELSKYLIGSIKDSDKATDSKQLTRCNNIIDNIIYGYGSSAIDDMQKAASKVDDVEKRIPNDMDNAASKVSDMQNSVKSDANDSDEVKEFKTQLTQLFKLVTTVFTTSSRVLVEIAGAMNTLQLHLYRL